MACMIITPGASSSVGWMVAATSARGGADFERLVTEFASKMFPTGWPRGLPA